jgi:hypothetical protein
VKVNRNDYRRALIMLRGLDKGMTGHVRLERRTMVGSLQFTVSGASRESALHAALMTKARGRWQGGVLGALGRDARGQAGLNVSFDPRNIEGLELNQYDLILVIREDADGAHVCMSGFMNGSVPVDWTQVHDAAAALFPRAAAAQPDECAAVPPPEAAPASPPETVLALPEAVQAAEAETAPARLETAAEAACAEAPGEAESSNVIVAVKKGADGAFQDADGNVVPIDQARMPAALLLDLDIAQAWPEAIERLRSVFLSEPAFTPFAADGFVFVRAPLPARAFPDYCAVGLKCENGAPTHVCYAIPGGSAADRLPGLDDYAWVAGENGGWWRLFLNVESGEVADMG